MKVSAEQHDSNTIRPLRAAVIGCGAIGRLHARAILDSPYAELVAVCDVDEEAARNVSLRWGGKVAHSIDALWQTTDLDVVTVATPDDFHTAPVIAAIQQGLHVFCEKPLALSAAEAESMRDAAIKHNVRLAVDYNRRIGFAYAKAHSLLMDAAATIRHLTIDVTDGIPAVSKQPFAILTSLLSHHIDLVRWYAGEIRTVSGMMHGPASNCPHTVTLTMETATGAIAAVTGSWRDSQIRTDETIRIVTDDQVIVVEGVSQTVRSWRSAPDSTECYCPNPFESGQSFFDTVGLHLSLFLDWIAGGVDRRIATAEDGCVALRVIEAAIRSNELQQRVHVCAGSQQ